MRPPAVKTPACCPSARATAAPRQRRKEARPQELLDSALALFVEKGYAATRAEEVAQMAGVSKGTLYLYYPSKEELFKAVVRRNLVNIIAEGQELVGQFEGSSSELLAKLMRVWWEQVGNTSAAGIHKIVLSEVRNFPDLAQFYTDEVILPSNALLCACVQRGIDRGEFRELPLADVAQALLAPMIFMALHRHSFGACPVRGALELDPVQALQTNLELILRGLEVRAPQRPMRQKARSAG